MRYTLSKIAEKDIEKLIEGSLLRFGIERTEKYQQELHRCLVLLSEEPKIGVAVDQIRKEYRKFPHDSHVIYYKVRRRDIFIVRVLHERMSHSQLN